MRRFAIALAAVALVGVAAGCGGDEDEGAVTTTANQTQAERMDVKGKDIVEVAQNDFFFEPAVLEGTPGQTLTIDLKNESAAAHTFTIEGVAARRRGNPARRRRPGPGYLPRERRDHLRLHVSREPRDGRQARSVSLAAAAIDAPDRHAHRRGSSRSSTAGVSGARQPHGPLGPGGAWRCRCLMR